jgi:hypothetical protein
MSLTLIIGKLSLFISGGQVVSDIEWQPTVSDTSAFTYRDLVSPAVSASLWARIEGVYPGQEATFISGSNHIFVNHIADYAEQYYLVVFVKTSEIYASTKQELDDMEEGNVTTSVIVVCTFVVLFALLMGAMLLLINGILKTFAEMENNVDKLLANVGHTERFLADGMVPVHSANTEELQNMQNNMNLMFRNMQAARDNSGTATTPNTGYQQSNAFFGMVPMSSTQPSAPPLSFAYEVDGAAAPNTHLALASVAVVPQAGARL